MAADPAFEPEKEHLIAIMLDTKLRPKCYHVVSVGTINETVRPGVVGASAPLPAFAGQEADLSRRMVSRLRLSSRRVGIGDKNHDRPPATHNLGGDEDHWKHLQSPEAIHIIPEISKDSAHVEFELWHYDLDRQFPFSLPGSIRADLAEAFENLKGDVTDLKSLGIPDIQVDGVLAALARFYQMNSSQ